MVECTHYQDSGEASASKPEAEEGGEGTRPSMEAWHRRLLHGCPRLWIQSGGGDTHTSRVGEYKVWDKIRLDELEKKRLCSFSLNMALHGTQCRHVFISTPPESSPGSFQKCRLGEAIWLLPTLLVAARPWPSAWIPWYLSKIEPRGKTWAFSVTREPSPTPHFHKEKKKTSSNLSNIFWLSVWLSWSFISFLQTWSLVEGGKTSVYMHLFLKERKLLEQKVPSLQGELHLYYSRQER